MGRRSFCILVQCFDMVTFEFVLVSFTTFFNFLSQLIMLLYLRIKMIHAAQYLRCLAVSTSLCPQLFLHFRTLILMKIFKNIDRGLLAFENFCPIFFLTLTRLYLHLQKFLIVSQQIQYSSKFDML